MALRPPHLGPRTRKVVRYAAFALFGLVTFVFAFQLTFPFDRVKDKVTELLSDKYDVTIGDVERGVLPGRVYFKAVSLRTRPTAPDDVATTFYIEQIEVNLGLFALLRGAVSVGLDAKIGPGHIEGTIALSKSGTSVDVEGSDLPSVSLPMREVIGLPMSGKVRFALALDVPTEKAKSGKVGPNWVKAEGRVELACPAGCTFGDGKAKLKAKLKNRAQQAFAEGGIDFGKVNVDTLLANVQIKNGKVDITKFDVKSTDGELHVDVNMALNQDINASTVTGCLRFKGSDNLLKREPKTHAAISTTGAPLGPDNLFHIKLDGPLREVRRLGQVCTGGGGGTVAAPTTPDNANGVGPVPTARPNLPAATPEVPARPAMNLPTPIIPAPPPPPPDPNMSPVLGGLLDAGVGIGSDSVHHVPPPPPLEGEVMQPGQLPPPAVQMPPPGQLPPNITIVPSGSGAPE